MHLRPFWILKACLPQKNNLPVVVIEKSINMYLLTSWQLMHYSNTVFKVKKMQSKILKKNSH